MSDQSLRELERRWQETGAVDDEAAYLRGRRRVGDLDPERLRLAAYCGHAGAVLALDEAVETPSDLEEWISGLARWGGEETVIRAAMAVARAGLATWEAEHPDDGLPLELLQVAEAAFQNPSQERRDALDDAVAGVAEIGGEEDREDTPAECAADATTQVGRAISFYVASTFPGYVDDPDQPVAEYIRGFSGEAAMSATRGGLSRDDLSAAVRGALFPDGP